MTRVVVLGGGFGGVEVIRGLARFFPRDSAIRCQPPRGAVCASHARAACERDVPS
jgi:hypothetical protein